ncbi:unnamed protein product [Vicia faba]|uniref:Uncharacterized protein n=1 Tax=Vicia faba TaxID=3906 RepID=A0AAV0YU71_VICFA|nr:unnamed protein product [Vicia faba]
MCFPLTSLKPALTSEEMLITDTTVTKREGGGGKRKLKNVDTAMLFWWHCALDLWVVLERNGDLRRFCNSKMDNKYFWTARVFWTEKVFFYFVTANGQHVFGTASSILVFGTASDKSAVWRIVNQQKYNKIGLEDGLQSGVH